MNKKCVIKTVRGDITKPLGVQAIVNAANSSLLGGGGVDGAIHRAAGKELLFECRLLGGCKTGQAKITKAYNLPCEYVIHTVGPVWMGGTKNEEEMLKSCYYNSMKLAMENNIRTIAFPSVSTGIYHFPVEQAAKTAVSTVADFLKENGSSFDLVEWVLFDEYTEKVYKNEVAKIQNDKIEFKYHPNVWEMNIFYEAKEGEYPTCECCGEKTKYSYESMYSEKEVECICPKCIASGEAAKKFDGEFIQFAEDSKVNDNEKKEELYCRTPGYMSWQGEYWLACCNDYCAFIGDVGTKELEEMGIADEVFSEYERRGGYKDTRKYMVKKGYTAGYLFQCLHCKKYHLWVDAD